MAEYRRFPLYDTDITAAQVRGESIRAHNIRKSIQETRLGEKFRSSTDPLPPFAATLRSASAQDMADLMTVLNIHLLQMRVRENNLQTIISSVPVDAAHSHYISHELTSLDALSQRELYTRDYLQDEDDSQIFGPRTASGLHDLQSTENTLERQSQNLAKADLLATASGTTEFISSDFDLIKVLRQNPVFAAQFDIFEEWLTHTQKSEKVIFEQKVEPYTYDDFIKRCLNDAQFKIAEYSARSVDLERIEKAVDKHLEAIVPSPTEIPKSIMYKDWGSPDIGFESTFRDAIVLQVLHEATKIYSQAHDGQVRDIAALSTFRQGQRENIRHSERAVERLRKQAELWRKYLSRYPSMDSLLPVLYESTNSGDEIDQNKFFNLLRFAHLGFTMDINISSPLISEFIQVLDIDISPEELVQLQQYIERVKEQRRLQQDQKK